MPCGDGGYPTHTVYVESGTQTQRLCAVFSALQRRGLLDQILDEIDWKEAGVTRQGTLSWWKQHQVEDAERRQREKKEKERQAKRSAVLNKLSVEEKKILGLK